MGPILRTMCSGVAFFAIVVNSDSSLAQDLPSSVPFREWAKAAAIPAHLGSDNDDVIDAAALSSVVGNARVVAIGEPMHGAHEPLAVRNSLIRILITRLGFTAVALESGFTESRALARFVAGQAVGDASHVVTSGMTWTFGEYDENRELIQWIRNYNAEPSHPRKIRLYGMDMTGGNGAGQLTGARAAADSALAVLGLVDERGAKPLRVRLEPALADLLPGKYFELPASRRSRLRRDLADLGSAIRRRRHEIVSRTSTEEYEWAMQNVFVADQLVRFYDVSPHDTSSTTLPPTAWRMMQIRDSVMFANIRWILQREGPQGRLVVFAHDAHVMNATLDGGPFHASPNKPHMLGTSLRPAFADELVTIATSGAVWKDSVSTAADSGMIDAVLLQTGRRSFLLDLRKARSSPNALAWLSRPQRLRANIGGDLRIIPRTAFDAIFFIDTLTPARKNSY